MDMNQILRQKITSPTHMRRFDSADYFMERDFPNSDEEGSRSRKNTDEGDLHEQLRALDDDRQSGSQQTRRSEPHIRHAPLVRKKPPPQLETRWATHTTRPAELALNSPHPAGPRALRQGSIHDVFADVEVEEDQADAETRAMADINAVLRAKLAGKSRLRRFDSADFFLNHETGRLQQRRPPPGLHHTVSSPGRVNTSSSSPRPNVSPIKSLAISTNVGSRSRGNSITDGSTATTADGQQNTGSASTDNTTEPPETTTRKTPLRGVIPSPNRLQRSRPRALQPGHQERYDLRTHLRQRAEIAAKVPQSPSDNVNVFFRKKYSPNTVRAMEAAGVGNKNLRRSLASLSGPSTPQKGSDGGSTPNSMPRQRRNSRAMPTSESLRTPADVRKAALHSRLNSQGKAL